MSKFDYLNKTYHLKACAGMRIKYGGQVATIITAKGMYLEVRFANGKVRLLHPIYNVEYPFYVGGEIKPYGCVRP